MKISANLLTVSPFARRRWCIIWRSRRRRRQTWDIDSIVETRDASLNNQRVTGNNLFTTRLFSFASFLPPKTDRKYTRLHYVATKAGWNNFAVGTLAHPILWGIISVMRIRLLSALQSSSKFTRNSS